MIDFKNIIWAYATVDRNFFENNPFMKSLLQKKITFEHLTLFVLHQDNLLNSKTADSSLAVSIRCMSEQDRPYIEQVEAIRENVIFIHGESGKAGLLSLLQGNMTILDYSRSDMPYYKQMMENIESVRCTEELERVAYNWVGFYYGQFRSDPIGRIKHRAFHQIGPIVKDIEHLHELLEGHQWREFVAHLERLRDEWQGTFPASQSLKSYLARVWYLMVGENFEWQKLGISPPNDVGLIPAAKGEHCCLLEILQRTHKGPLDSIDEWQALVKLLQLSESGTGTFTLKSGAGVYRFACLMDDLIAEPELFNQQKLYSGFENNKLLTDELEAFQDWFRKVNKQLQLLRGKWQPISLLSATRDSEAS